MLIKKRPYQLDEKRYTRFPVYRQSFATVSYQDTGGLSTNGFLGKMLANMGLNMAQGKKDRLQVDNALDMGANALNLILGDYGAANRQFLKWEPMLIPEMFSNNRVKLSSEDLTVKVKEGALLYGADLVGITDVKEAWIFSHDMEKPYIISEEGKPRETEEGYIIPKSVNKAIVIAVAMDEDMIETSPSVPASTATSLGYSRMAITVVALAEYIRALGYIAIPSMNDTALSIPLAIDAGLGQLGRHGLLITPEFGSNIRLCKVITDMPLITDEPIDFGVTEFCDSCHLCADHCPPKAISKGKPTMEGPCENNNPGAEKWYVHCEKCLRFWQVNGASCANCISVCPFTYGFESMQCMECVKCDTRRGCELQVNTHERLKHGYLEGKYWGGRNKVLKPRRRGL
jgi:reductive dehalogenase